jgi:hypothetical protein
MATTTNYSWNTPDNTAYVKDGASAIRTLGSSVDSTLFTALGGAYPGLRLVKKQTIGSAVTSISVTSAFSAAYDNYRILFNAANGTGGSGCTFQLTGITGSNYLDNGFYMSWTSATITGYGPAFATSWNTNFNNTTGTPISFQMDLFNPFNAVRKNASVFAQSGNGSSQTNHTCNSATSATGFTISRPGGDSFTGGTIYVYGYGAS